MQHVYVIGPGGRKVQAFRPTSDPNSSDAATAKAGKAELEKMRSDGNLPIAVDLEEERAKELAPKAAAKKASAKTGGN